MELKFVSLIKSHYEDLSKSEKKVADYLIENIDTASFLSIKDVAAASETSIATISRLSKKLGFKNYQELRLLLNSSQSSSENFFSVDNIGKEDSLVSIAKTAFLTGINSLTSTQAVLDNEDLERTVRLLEKSSSCGLFGFGGSNVVTLNAYHRFIRTSLKCIYSQDFHMQLMNAANMTSEDCALIVSHTGKNSDILRIVELLKKNEVPIIAITSNASSPLANSSDITLISISEETKYRPEAVSSLVAQITLIDSLFMIYALKVDDDYRYFTRTRETINKTRMIKDN